MEDHFVFENVTVSGQEAQQNQKLWTISIVLLINNATRQSNRQTWLRNSFISILVVRLHASG